MDEILRPDCAHCPLLDDMGGCPDDLSEPGIAGRTRASYTAGERLFQEGETIGGICCLRSGRAALVKGSDGGEWVVAVATPGDVLGVPDILGEERHQNGALAIEDTSVCFIPKPQALSLLQTNPQIMIGIMRKMCERIRSMEQHIERHHRGDSP